MTNKMSGYKVEVDTNGTKCWYLNGKFHREDGPAVERTDGTKSWYLGGKPLTEQEHKEATTKATCDGKEVVIDGITYVLKEKQNDLALSTNEAHGDL